jgi:transposase
LVKAFYQRLRQAGKPPMATVCAAMRKLLHIIYGVLKHRAPLQPKLGPLLTGSQDGIYGTFSN